MIFINFKTYTQATGKRALSLALLCQKVAAKTGVNIVVSPQTADIYRLALKVNIPIFAQHLDPVQPGRNTGLTTAACLKQAGASGVFLNHSEHPFLEFCKLAKAVKIAKTKGLTVLVFAKSVALAQKIDELKPDYIALEEPSLIAKKAMVKIAKFKKEIKAFSQTIQAVPLIGAGIKTQQDAATSLSLGAQGIAFASGFVQAAEPESVLLDICQAFQ